MAKTRRTGARAPTYTPDVSVDREQFSPARIYRDLRKRRRAHAKERHARDEQLGAVLRVLADIDPARARLVRLGLPAFHDDDGSPSSSDPLPRVWR